MIIDIFIDYFSSYRYFLILFMNDGWYQIFAVFFAISFLCFIPFLIKYIRR